MTSFSGPPEFINEMLGLPQENWFKTLDAASDWSALVANPVGDLAETERVFRTIWSASTELVRSKPRVFLAFDAKGPEAMATTGALRAIGATRLAGLIEKHNAGPSSYDRYRAGDITEAAGDVRDLLIRYLTERGVFPLAPTTKETT
jgi:hypothetical protein